MSQATTESWSTYDMHKDGQTDWLVHMYETVINGIRANQLPSEVDDEYTLSAALTRPPLLQPPSIPVRPANP